MTCFVKPPYDGTNRSLRRQRLQNDPASIDSASPLLKVAIPAKEDRSPAVDPTDASYGKGQSASVDASAAPNEIGYEQSVCDTSVSQVISKLKAVWPDLTDLCSLAALKTHVVWTLLSGWRLHVPPYA